MEKEQIISKAKNDTVVYTVIFFEKEYYPIDCKIVGIRTSLFGDMADTVIVKPNGYFRNREYELLFEHIFATFNEAKESAREKQKIFGQVLISQKEYEEYQKLKNKIN